MNEIFPTFFFVVIVLAAVVVSLVETAVSALWLPAYFRYSIPLFRQDYPLMALPDLAGKIPELEHKLKRRMWRPGIVFRVLNEHEIAFRNNFGSRNNMSGLIRLEPSLGRMRISGNLYWMVFVLPPLILAFMLSSPFFPSSFFFFIFMVVLFGLTFAMQRYQYGKIAAVIVATVAASETAVFAPPAPPQTLEPFQQSYQPKTTEFDPSPYDPVLYDPQSKKPQTGMTNVELALIIVLMALVAIAASVAILFF